MRKGWVEWLVALAVCGLIMTASSLPNWLGHSLTDEQVTFKGQYFDTQDYAVDVAMIRAGMQGDWVYQMRFTTEEHDPAFTRLFYLALGHAAKTFSLEAETAYEAARWLFGLLALWSLYALADHYFKKKLLKWSAFLLAVFGSGLGWLQLLAGIHFGPITPIDFWLIDAYVFFSLSLFPHFACTLALMAGGLLAWLKFLQRQRWGYVAAFILAALLTQMVNPIAFVLVDIAVVFTTLFSLWRERNRIWFTLAALGLAALAQLPLLIYNVRLLSADPIWSIYTAQNVTLSPPLMDTLFGFGLLLPLAVMGAVIAIKKKDPALTGLAAWALAGFILAYLPTLIQRRFLLGVTIPLGYLCIGGLDALFNRLSQRRPINQTFAYAFFILMAGLSSLYLVYGNLLVIKGRPESLYYPSALNPALDWLKVNAESQDFVLGAESSGQLVAQKTGLRVYLGHEMETIHYAEKMRRVSEWYQADLPIEVLSQLPVQWVIYGPYEQALAPEFSAGGDLLEIYNAQGVSIYKVMENLVQSASPSLLQ